MYSTFITIYYRAAHMCFLDADNWLNLYKMAHRIIDLIMVKTTHHINFKWYNLKDIRWKLSQVFTGRVPV